VLLFSEKFVILFILNKKTGIIL